MQQKNQQGLENPNIDEDDMFQYGGFIPDNKTDNDEPAKLGTSKQSEKQAGQHIIIKVRTLLVYSVAQWTTEYGL